MSGYSERMFEEEVNPKFNCAICLFLLKDPVQTPCGHLFCFKCIVKSIREFDEVCPIDNKDLTEPELHADRAVKREMSVLKVKCPNVGYGCGWHGTLGEFENQHENQCPFFPRPRNPNMPQEHDEDEE